MLQAQLVMQVHKAQQVQQELRAQQAHKVQQVQQELQEQQALTD